MKYLTKDTRPWGSFYVIHDEPNYKLKRIEVEPSKRLSYQYHHKRSETWIIVQGTGLFTLNGDDKKVSVGETVLIPRLSKHRILNTGEDLLVIIEVQTGSYFGEDDIVRIEDDYNRHNEE